MVLGITGFSFYFGVRELHQIGSWIIVNSSLGINIRLIYQHKVIADNQIRISAYNDMI